LIVKNINVVLYFYLNYCYGEERYYT